MTKMPGEYKYRNQVIALFSISAVFVASYLALFAMTISNTFNYQKTEKSISSVTAEISSLEFSYLSSEAKINASLAENLGFVEPKNITIAKSSESQTAFVSTHTE